jgi:hypothetical protein
MKQLRLISNTESQADFNVLFQEPILIKPNSTIGLQNFSLFFDDEMIEVNDDNNSFVMEFTDTTFGQSNMGQFKLANGTYNASSFLVELNTAINRGLISIDLSPLGLTTYDSYMEVSCVYDKVTNNLSITYALESRDTNPSYLSPAFISFDGTSGYTKSPTSPFPWAFSFTEKTFSDGQGTTYLRTSNTLGTTTGIAIGLVELENTSGASIIGVGLSPAKYNFCAFNDDGTFWKVKYPNGTTLTTTYAVGTTDIIEITKGAWNSGTGNVFNEFGYTIVLHSGTTVAGDVLGQIPFTYGEQLHGAFSIRDITSEIQNYTFTPSPSNVADKYGSGIHIVKDFRLLEKNNYYSKNVNGTPEPPFKKLYLNLGENVAKLLGFTNPETNTITGATGAWDADISIYATVIPSSILVELPNTHIHSYDGDVYYKRRRNILSIIPSVNLEQENTKITYEPAFPVMLDMLNKNDELLTNVRVRILDLDNVPLRINANKGCSLSVLIQ